METYAHDLPTGSAAQLASWLESRDWPRLGVLQAALDAHLLCEEETLAVRALEQLFAVWWPTRSLADVVADLCAAGFLVADPDDSCAVPSALRPALAAALAGRLQGQPLALPVGSAGFGQLLEGFAAYCREEAGADRAPAPFGEAAAAYSFTARGRRHVLALRPFPLHLGAHPQAFIALLCELPPAALAAIAQRYTAAPALRSRLALFDLANAYKVNLTRSEVFVYFERYLRRAYGVRLTPPPLLTNALLDSGLLSLDKG